tara:strand:+ start:809 stop:1258 length:450 start_codon:yes stop_codon:yes gene_type:complete
MKPKVKTWLRNIENGNIRNFTEKILNEIKANTPDKFQSSFFDQIKEGISTYELRESLEISHQSLTAILSNLTDEGLIKQTGEHATQESIYSIYMFIHDIEYRSQLIIQRKLDRYHKWLKNADQYLNFMDASTVQMICYEQEKNEIYDKN